MGVASAGEAPAGRRAEAVATPSQVRATDDASAPTLGTTTALAPSAPYSLKLQNVVTNYIMPAELIAAHLPAGVKPRTVFGKALISVQVAKYTDECSGANGVRIEPYQEVAYMVPVVADGKNGIMFPFETSVTNPVARDAGEPYDFHKHVRDVRVESTREEIVFEAHGAGGASIASGSFGQRYGLISRLMGGLVEFVLPYIPSIFGPLMVARDGQIQKQATLEMTANPHSSVRLADASGVRFAFLEKQLGTALAEPLVAYVIDDGTVKLSELAAPAAS
jgi:hypothetical protein